MRRSGGCVWLAPLLGLLGLLPATHALAQVITAQVEKVLDGDTLVVRPVSAALGRTDALRVRLYGIDTPEKDQPWGDEARRALAILVEGRQVSIEPQEQDRYGRMVGVVLVGRRDVNRALVEQGHAWVYRQYERDPAACLVEAEARVARRGLWAAAPAAWVAPWQWRQYQRGQRQGVQDYSRETAAMCRRALRGRARSQTAATTADRGATGVCGAGCCPTDPAECRRASGKPLDSLVTPAPVML
ncbi:MAG: hypothetical protein RL026_2709 [Pseudomonadota bacterium]|jgi:endonuclease YncB( thermonuclease family)